MNPIHHKPLQLKKVGDRLGLQQGTWAPLYSGCLLHRAVIKLGLGSLGSLIKARDISQWDHLSIHSYHVDGDLEVGQGVKQSIKVNINKGIFHIDFFCLGMGILICWYVFIWKSSSIHRYECFIYVHVTFMIPVYLYINCLFYFFLDKVPLCFAGQLHIYNPPASAF